MTQCDHDRPFTLFGQWYDAALAAEPSDTNAMALATTGADGLPSVRIVLLKGWDARGFVFFTNFDSRKGRELIAHPAACLNFHWKSLRRQIRISGTTTIVTPAEADDYFASRPRASQIGAWASQQSQPLDARTTLETRVAEIATRYEGSDVPRPPHWGGFRLAPEQIEFWQDQPNRLHERHLFTRTPGGWTETLLYP